jgi:hypothetical protein
MLKTLLFCAGLLVIADPLLSTGMLGALQADVTFSATAKTCFNTTPHPVGGVAVSFFKVSSARSLVAHLDSMNTFVGFGRGDDATASGRFDTMQAALRRLIWITPWLGSRTTAPNGTVAMTISPIDSLLVVGYADMEDQPYVWDYKIMRGDASASFILDMSRGQCGF